MWVTHPLDMGFDFIVFVPILPSHCGFFFVFGSAISGILLSMVVQQLVVALVSSTPSSWIRRNDTFCLISLLSESEVAQSCPTLCNPMDCSPPGSSTRGILQARIRDWVAISSCRGSSRPRDQILISCSSPALAGRLSHGTTREAPNIPRTWYTRWTAAKPTADMCGRPTGGLLLPSS